MTGKTHQIIGITSGLAVFFIQSNPQYSPATFATVIVGSYLMSLLPDFDTANGSFWKSIPLGKVIGRTIDPLIEHRNFSHSLLGILIIGWLVFKLINFLPDYWEIDKQLVFFPLLTAYISHLIADMITVEGIPVFFPYKKMFGIPPKPFNGARIVSGKWFENFVLFPFLICY